jgi:hypothetical protein
MDWSVLWGIHFVDFEKKHSLTVHSKKKPLFCVVFVIQLQISMISIYTSKQHSYFRDFTLWILKNHFLTVHWRKKPLFSVLFVIQLQLSKISIWTSKQHSYFGEFKSKRSLSTHLNNIHTLENSLCGFWKKTFFDCSLKKETFIYVECISSIHFSFFGYLVKVTEKRKNISSPVCLLFTEKVNFLLVNKEKNSQLKLVLRSWKNP